MSNWFRMNGYLTMFELFILSSTFNRFARTEQQLLTYLLGKIHQNPNYFYNLNPTLKRPAFKLGLTDSPPAATAYLVNGNKPIFSVQIQPEHQLQQQQFVNGPSKVLYVQSNDRQPIRNPSNTFHPNENKYLNPPINSISPLNPFNTLNPIDQFEQNLNRRNQLFYNRIGLVNENRLHNEFTDATLSGNLFKFLTLLF